MHFIWIPSHKNIKGNELADKFARSALNNEDTDNSKVPFSNLFSIFKSRLKDCARTKLKEEGLVKGVKYFQNSKEILVKPWFAKITAEMTTYFVY